MKTIDVYLTVRSSAPEEQLRTIAERAEKSRYIKSSLEDRIECRQHLNIKTLPTV